MCACPEAVSDVSWKKLKIDKGSIMVKKRSEAFEDALKKLQEIVEKLERGDLPLEDAMKSFTEGVQLAQFCHQKLEEAENKIQTLLKDEEGNWAALPMERVSSEKSQE